MNIGYLTETRSRWGNTDAYREHEQKTKNYTKEKWAEANDGLIAIFAEFAACKNSGASADSSEAQALVVKLQAHITANYYDCTNESVGNITNASGQIVGRARYIEAGTSAAARLFRSTLPLCLWRLLKKK